MRTLFALFALCATLHGQAILGTVMADNGVWQLVQASPQSVNGPAGCGGSSGTTCTAAVTATARGIAARLCVWQTANQTATFPGGWTKTFDLTDTVGNTVSCARNFTLAAGTTSIAVTVANNTARAWMFWSILANGGTIAFDNSNTASDASSGTPAAPSLSISGKWDIVFQNIVCPAVTYSSISGGYTGTLISGATNRVAATLLNQTAYAAPTWTWSAPAVCSVAAEAWKIL